MLKTETKKIGTHDVSVTQLPGRQSLRLKTRLLMLFGTAIFDIVNIVKDAVGSEEKITVKNLLTSDIDFKSLGDTIERVFAKVSPEVWEEIVFQIIVCTRLDNKEITPDIFDMEFAGNLKLLYQIIGYTLKVNYGSDFFG